MEISMKQVNQIKINNYSLLKSQLAIKYDCKLTFIASSKDGFVSKCYVLENDKIYQIENVITFDYKPLESKNFYKYVSKFSDEHIENSKLRSYRYYLLFEEELSENQQYIFYSGVRFGPMAGGGKIKNCTYKNKTLIVDQVTMQWMV